MSRRIIAAIVAVLLAAVGGVLLASYVSAADARAMAGLQTVEVLVVAEPVLEGTTGEDAALLVETRALPATAVVPGAVTDAAALEGLVALTDLQPGEQVLGTRFGAPESAAQGVEVPEGMHEVSVLLDPQRVLGGTLTVGSTVGVVVSLSDPSRTHLVLHKVLVTKVQGAVAAPEPAEGQETPAAEPVPQSSLIVTFAASPRDVETIVFAAEYGSIWLSLEPEGASEDGTRVVTAEAVIP